jgi:hypothetical protein
MFLYQTPVSQSVLCPLSPGIGNIMPGVEFNFYADPEASFILFDSVNATDSNMNPIFLFPWESVVKRNTILMVRCGLFICIVSIGLSETKSYLEQANLWEESPAFNEISDK